MAIKTNLLFIFVFSLFLLSTTLALGHQKEDPELDQCQHQCRHQQQFSPKQRQECEKRCEAYHKDKYQHGGQRGGDEPQGQDPTRELQACKQACRQVHVQGREDCQKRCDNRYEQQQREQEQQGRGGDRGEQGQEVGEEQEQGSQGKQQGGQEQEQGSQGRHGEQDDNPYVFHQQHFRSKIRSHDGSMRVLQRFSKRSNLLLGIDNYRLAIVEANPNTFTIPNHWDADTVCIVLNGRGAITILEENNKETYKLERGDIIRVPAGRTVYVVNSDNNEKLYVAKLVRPVSNPGQFEVFFGAGGRDPESFYNAFSDEILQAAFNVPSTKVHRLFQGQRKGAIVRASREQIESLTRHASSSSGHAPWPLPPFRPQSSEGTFNLFNKRPSQSNEFGKLYQVDQDDYKQLRDLDIAISFANITRGAMLGPYYNSRAAKVCLVVDGSGYIEMACPHLAKQQRRQGGQGEQGQGQGQEQGQGREKGSSSTSYHKVRARVSSGDAIVVPAGHPIVSVASRDNNLQVVCFEINAENNKKYPLAGRNNILRQLEREAKELSFDIPARQVDEILEKQDQSWFFPGPDQQQEGQGNAYA